MFDFFLTGKWLYCSTFIYYDNKFPSLQWTLTVNRLKSPLAQGCQMTRTVVVLVLLIALVGIISCDIIKKERYAREESQKIVVTYPIQSLNQQFYVKMDVGTPGVPVKMLLDINSGVTAIPIQPWCDASTNCYGNSSYYPAYSSTVSGIPCSSSCTDCSDTQELGGKTEQKSSITRKSNS
jgi:hypothetical protein